MEIKDKELHRIVATAFIYKSDFSYLIIKRAAHKKVMPNKWAPSGGGLNVDDYINTKPTTNSPAWYGTMEKALTREVKEEVNLKIGPAEFLTDYTFIRPDGIPVLGLSYFAPYLEGEVRLDEDATDFKWIKVNDIKKYDFVEGVEEELLEVDKILKKRQIT